MIIADGAFSVVNVFAIILIIMNVVTNRRFCLVIFVVILEQGMCEWGRNELGGFWIREGKKRKMGMGVFIGVIRIFWYFRLFIIFRFFVNGKVMAHLTLLVIVLTIMNVMNTVL